MQYTHELSYQFPFIRGEDVRTVQQALIALHIQPPCGTADGVFGAMTEACVKSFQSQYNVGGRQGDPLPLDGKVDEATWQALIRRAVAVRASAARVQTAADVLTATPPSVDAVGIKPAPGMTREQVIRVRNWLMTHFADEIAKGIAGTPFDADLVCAIACQETASVWLPWIDTMTPDQILADCVFDASGDAPGTNRVAFPANTGAFRAKYGDVLTQQLINAANTTRGLRKLPPQQWVYKGYGIFQYDLQNIQVDADFFTQHQWYSFASCMDRLMAELREKLAAAQGDVRDAVRRYNGATPAAELYAANVMQMQAWSASQVSQVDSPAAQLAVNA
jgi:hypothetical protein